MLKVCSVCTIEKEQEEFHIDNRNRDGLRSFCKSCVRTYQEEYKKRNPEKIKERDKLYSSDYYKKNKERIDTKNRNYYYSHPKEAKEYRRVYYQKNKETLSLQRKEYREKNKEKLKHQKELYLSKPGIKERKAEYDRLYHLKNKDKRKEQRKAWRLLNKDRIAEKQRQRIKDNRLKRQEEVRKSYLKNKDKRNQYDKEYWKKNPDKLKQRNIRRRISHFGAEGDFFQKDINNTLFSQIYLCSYCSKNIELNYTIDHIIPLTKGGSNYPSNISLACKSCNCSKRNILLEDWKLTPYYKENCQGNKYTYTTLKEMGE